MRTTTRVVGAAVAGALATALAGASLPASANTAPVAQPETFAGSATGTALNLRALGNKVTFGVSNASLDSTLKVAADGAGSLSLLGTNTSKVSALGTSDPATGERCATPAIPQALSSTINIGIACTRSQAKLLGEGLPMAQSFGSVSKIDVTATNALTALPVKIDQKPVRDALETVVGTLPQGAVADTVGQLLDKVLDTQTLAVRLGPSTSDVTSKTDEIVSTSSAEGGRIDILPNGAIDGGPLASVIIGSAKATAAYDRVAGTSAPAFDPALVTVRLGATPLAPATEIKVAPGVTQCFLDVAIPSLGTPLKSCVTVANGTTSETVDPVTGHKVVKAVADGVKLELLTGLQGGGIVLELAHAEAQVTGKPAIAEPPVVEPPVERPRAGDPFTPRGRTGGLPLLPLVGSGALAAAAVGRRFLNKVG